MSGSCAGPARIFRDFSGWTSAHGIPHIGTAQRWQLKLFWSLVFLVSLTMFCVQMSLLVLKFQRYDVTVQTELRFEERTFPAVTFCNLNPYQYSLKNRSDDLVSLMNTYQQFLVEGKTDKTDPPNVWKIRDAKDTIIAQNIAQTHLLYIGRNMENKTRDALSYKLKGDDFKSGFVLEGEYNGRPLKIKDEKDGGDFKKVIDPFYGVCHKFNDNGTYRSSRAGPAYGMWALVLSNQAEYLPLTESAGIRVAFHPQKQEPFPDAFGYNAAAGFTTSYGIKYVKTKRIPAPHGDCRVGKPDDSYYYEGPYSVEGCFRSCAQKTIYEGCGCCDPRYNPPSASAPYCGTKNQTGRDCVTEYNEKKNEKILSVCKCPQPCEQQSYSVTVSTALWPSDAYTPTPCRTAATKLMPWHLTAWPIPLTLETPKDVVEKACRKWFSENTMLIEAFYERMNFLVLQESEAYTFVNLVSDMGGQLGLWLGISVITGVELFSLLVLLCLYCIARPDLSKIDAESEEESSD